MEPIEINIEINKPQMYRVNYTDKAGTKYSIKIPGSSIINAIEDQLISYQDKSGFITLPNTKDLP